MVAQIMEVVPSEYNLLVSTLRKYHPLQHPLYLMLLLEPQLQSKPMITTMAIVQMRRKMEAEF
jgi:hypothetical protein